MNKENAIAKINKYGKIAKIITTIMLVIFGIGIVTTLLSVIILKVIPKDALTINIGTQAEVIIDPAKVDSNFDESTLQMVTDSFNNGTVHGGLNLGAVSLTMNSAKIVDNKVVCKTNEATSAVSLSKIGSALIWVVVAMILAFISIVFGRKLCKAIEKCETPFEENVINTMRKFAFSLLPWAIFSDVPEYAINNVFSNNINVGINVNLNIIFLVLIILALTIVFKYGAILQVESDETL